MRLNGAVAPAVFGEADDEMLGSLTLWAVQQRCPADQPEPSSADANEALDFGKSALARIGERFGGRPASNA